MFDVLLINFVEEEVTEQFGDSWYDEEGGGYQLEKTHHFKNIELLQFTGLCDKNGNRILEGDIVRRTDGNWNGSPLLVVWDKGSCSFKLKEPNREPYAGIYDSQPWEVIGNIYSNPELLQQEGSG